MTSKQFEQLWELAQPVSREHIEQMGNRVRRIACKELYPGTYGEIWIGTKGRYYYCEVKK